MTTTASKLALAAVLAASFAAPAHADGWVHRNFGWMEFWNGNSSGHYTTADNYNNHVDFVKDDMAPHANISSFDTVGVDPSRNSWEKMTPAQRNAVKDHIADARNMGMRPTIHETRDGAVVAPSHADMMDHRHHDMKNMTPEQREAAKARWEQKRHEWDAMTPEQRAAAKARWDAKHAQ